MRTVSGDIAGFQSAIADSYFPYQIDRVCDPEHFESAYAVGEIGSVLISRTYVSHSFCGHRSERHSDDKRSYILMLIEEGLVSFKGQRNAVARSGDFILLNAQQPLESEQRTAGWSLAVSFPAQMLKLNFAQIDSWCLTPRTSTEGTAAILRECLAGYWRMHGRIHPSEYNDLGMSLVHLVGAVFKEQTDSFAIDSPSMHAHFLRVANVVSQNLEHPELSAEFVSDRLGISKSYLYMIMNAANTTLGRFVLDKRLERSRELLADPGMSRHTISDIAFSLGFQELSHFSRRFTEKFGMCPRAFRGRIAN